MFLYFLVKLINKFTNVFLTIDKGIDIRVLLHFINLKIDKIM